MCVLLLPFSNLMQDIERLFFWTHHIIICVCFLTLQLCQPVCGHRWHASGCFAARQGCAGRTHVVSAVQRRKLSEVKLCFSAQLTQRSTHKHVHTITITHTHRFTHTPAFSAHLTHRESEEHSLKTMHSIAHNHTHTLSLSLQVHSRTCVLSPPHSPRD